MLPAVIDTHFHKSPARVLTTCAIVYVFCIEFGVWVNWIHDPFVRGDEGRVKGSKNSKSDLCL